MPDLKAAYKRLDPSAPLSGDGLTKYYLPRSDDRMALLSEELKSTEQPTHVLLAGQRGVGKSTELNRLQAAIGRARRIVRYVVSKPKGTNTDHDCSTYFDGTNPKRSAYREEVLLIDGCERLNADQATQCLNLLADIDATLIVAAPAKVALGGDVGEGVIGTWDRVIPVSAVPIDDWDGTERRPNFTAREYLRAIITRRAGEDAFEPNAIGQIIEASGGLHRDLLTLAQQACLRSDLAGLDHVTSLYTGAAIEERRQELNFQLTPAERQTLRGVRHAGPASLDVEGIDFVPLLERNIFIAYYSRMTWLAIHPLISPQSARLAISQQ